uniref:Mitochondrial import receptor subunit TOM7 homolog n=1 Tax=Panagrolaimus sp. PS1159 TaxID=55785 RepID=A0AC35EZX0_9BILA
MADMSDISRLDQSSAFKEICSHSAAALRVGLQYGFLPLVLYLGFRRGGQLPTGEPVQLGITSLLWG